MDKLISTVEEKDPPLNHVSITDLGHCIAYLVAEDFSTRIFPATSQESDQLEESIASPFFVLCRNIFSSAKPFSTKSINLLIHVSKFLEATGFLLLYYLRGKCTTISLQDAATEIFNSLTNTNQMI